MAQTIIVDISTRGANPVAYTHQGDTGRTFFAEIYENGEAFAVAGYTIKVGAILPADRGYYVIAGNDMVTATKTNDNTTNKIYFTLSENYSLKAGNGILTLIFTSNTGTPSTIRPINIDLRIQKSADADDTIAGASDFPEGLEAIAEEVFQEYLSTYLPPVAPSASAAANKAADAKLTGEAIDDLKSDLDTLNEGGLVLKDDVIAENVESWLDDHPEATTTVEDGTLTVAKYSENLKKRLVVCVTDYGIDNTGVLDCSAALNSLFANNGSATYYFPKGIYKINDTLNLDKSCSVIFSADANITVSEPVDVLFNIAPTWESPSDVFGYKNFVIRGGNIDCGGNVDTVFQVGVTYKSHIYDMRIKNFNDYGIHILGGGHFVVDNCLLWGVAGNATFGYYNAGYDGNVLNTVVVNCSTGFSASTDLFTNCTAWIDERGTYSGSVCFENRGKNFYTQCTADTYEIGWKGLYNSSTNITNGNVMNNDGVATPSSATHVLYGETQAKFYYMNLFIALSPSFTFVNGETRVSGSNLIDAENTGTNLPDLKTFNDITVNTQTQSNFTATSLNDYTSDASINGFFETGAIDFRSGWGNLEVKRTSSAIIQKASITGCPTFTRSSTNNGSSWTSWTQNYNAVERKRQNITVTTANNFRTNSEYIGWFEAGVTGTAGWGYIRTIVSDSFIFQYAIINGGGAKSRISSDSGSTWGAWS